MPRRGDNIYKRKDARWEGRYPCGYHADGRTKYRSVYGRSYKEVKEKLEEARKQQSQGIQHTNLTVKVLFDEWLLKISSHAKESTIANYRMKITKHLLPSFGGLRYDHLNAQMVHEFIQKKLQSGLSEKYVADILIVFKTMTKYVSREHGYHNPLANVTLPKVADCSEVQILGKQQQYQLTVYLNQHRDRTSLGILLSMYTGLRIGELCAMTWQDIDLEQKVLTVRRTMQRIADQEKGHGTKLIMTTPKSQSSIRCIPIPECLHEWLRQFCTQEEDFILSGNTKPIEPRTLQYRFSTVLKKANLPSVPFHSLRHLFATNCIKLGFDVKTLSEILGHASVEITLNRYVHSSLEQKRYCMNLLTMNN